MGTSAITEPEWLPTVVSIEGRFVEASNATLLGTTAAGEQVIYKPVSGARPLWDFDADSLAQREVWTYRIDRALGLGVVPQTAMGTGPFGAGAVQRLVEGAADQKVVDIINANDPAIWPIAILDVVVNNADRKVGHMLRSASGKLWAIDHGLTFHYEDKLRTVLWGFAGRAVPEALLAAAAQLASALDGELGEQLATELGHREHRALQTRVSSLLEARRHPEPPEDRPAIPWPPY